MLVIDWEEVLSLLALAEEKSLIKSLIQLIKCHHHQLFLS